MVAANNNRKKKKGNKKEKKLLLLSSDVSSLVATGLLTETWEPGQVLALSSGASLFKSTTNIHSPSLFETAGNLVLPDKPEIILVLYLGMSNLVNWMSQVLREPVLPRGSSTKALPLAKILINETTWFVDPTQLTAKLPKNTEEPAVDV